MTAVGRCHLYTTRRFEVGGVGVDDRSEDLRGHETEVKELHVKIGELELTQINGTSRWL